jgi:hypothetical protein
MAVQGSINTEVELFCFEQNRWRRCAVLPWRTSSQASEFSQASTRSDYDEAELANEIEATATPDPLAQPPNPLSPAELHSLYAGTTVPQHRYLASALFAAVNSPAIALDPAKWFSELEDIQLSSVAGAWLNTNNNSSYEQLKCVGFDSRTNQLTAVLAIKQCRGYLGDANTAGSQEFVAFWVDWGFGFQYEGTASAAVFDSSSHPGSEREIRVGLPVDFSRHELVEGLAAATIKVRAVLSWNTPPSTTHPYAPVVWGNSLDLRLVISSHHVVHSSKEADFLTSSWRGNSALTFNADDLADRGASVTQHRMDLAHWIRDTASC